MTDELQAKCEICEKVFEPTPDSFVEWEMGVEEVPENEVDSGIPVEELESMNEFDLKAVELTPDQRDAILRGETVKYGGCICPSCMDEMVADSEEEEGAED